MADPVTLAVASVVGGAVVGSAAGGLLSRPPQVPQAPAVPKTSDTAAAADARRRALAGKFGFGATMLTRPAGSTLGASMLLGK